MPKSRVVKQTLANKEVLGLFQETLGGGNSEFNPEITWPKFKRLRHHVRRYALLVEWLAARPYLIKAFPNELRIISAWVSSFTTDMNAVFGAVPNLDSYASEDELRVFAECVGESDQEAAQLRFVPPLARVPADAMKLFREQYQNICSHRCVNLPILTCKNLLPHRGSLETRGELKAQFLRQAGLSFAPLPGLEAANFKAFCQSDQITANNREVLLVFLHRLYTISYKVYQIASEPDVNVDDFVEVVMESLKSVKSQIPRCDLAFKKIVESVELLKGNFGTYFREFKASGDSTIMLQNFIADVAQQNGGANPRLTMQFQRIISHYRKISSQQSKDPRIQALFTQVDANLKELEKLQGSNGEPAEEDQPKKTPAEEDQPKKTPVEENQPKKTPVEEDQPTEEDQPKKSPVEDQPTEEDRPKTPVEDQPPEELTPQEREARRKRLRRVRQNTNRQINEFLDAPATATDAPTPPQ